MSKMAGLVSTLCKEIVWVLTPTKFGNLQIQHGDYWTVFCSLPLSVGILLIRHILSSYCFIPFGQHLGIKDVHPIAPPNPALELVYRKKKKLTQAEVVSLSKQLDLPEREIQKWWRRRRKQDKPATIDKFCQTCWRCTYYTCLFTYGLVILYDKPWFWDFSQSWVGYPTQPVTADIWWYYVISLSFYWSLFFGQFFLDAKRSDFWQMFIHHTASLALLSFSWLAGVYRIGTLVLVVHDCADVFVEAAKSANYAKCGTTCTSLFSVFTVVWIVTRLGIFPFWILKETIYGSISVNPDFKAYYTFNGLLILLVILHCFWTYLILRMVYRAVGAGQVEGDIRSSSEED